MSRMPAATISSTPPSSGSSARAHTCDGRERASARLVKSWASGRGSTKSDAGVDVVDLERAARCVWDPLVVHASRGVGGDAPNAMQQVFLRLAAQACRRSPQQLPHTAERPSITPATDR